jgi:hypothetical protein
VTFYAKTLIFESLLMNYQGNALKYTRAGYIRVRLEAHNQPSERTSQDGEEQAPATIVKLTVTDTGQGMSPQFMRTKVGYVVGCVWQWFKTNIPQALHTLQSREFDRARNWSWAITSQIYGHHAKRADQHPKRTWVWY